MKQFLCRLTALAVLILTTAARGQAPEPIVYRVRVPDPGRGEALVEARVPTGKQPAIQMMMPIWTPGYYRVENYASKVSNFKARTSDDKELQFEQPAKNRWKIETGGAATIVLTYQLACTSRSVTGNFVGKDLLILNGGPAFMTLADKTKRPHEVALDLPEGWKQSMSGLPTAADGKLHHFMAADYDTLVDSPIMAGALAVEEFEVAGSKHYVVAGGETAPWDGKRAAADLKKIVEENQRFWGPLPYKKYAFLFSVKEKGGGGGGLEHANSALMMSGSSATRGEAPNVSWLGFVSHEFFHAFNVKRLRPVELGPFDYEKEPRTSGLWVAEGLTTYYGDLLVARAGLTSAKDYLSRLSGHIEKLQKSPGRLVQSLNQASLEVWTSSMSGVGSGPKTISYYTKGPVVGFLLDAKIRRATKGAQSLDDVMRLAYRRYGGEHGFSAEQFRQTAEEVAGIDLKEAFRKWLDTTDELDYSEALDWFGLALQPETWRLGARDDASDAQKAHFKNLLARTEKRRPDADKLLPDSKLGAIPEEVIQRYKLDTTFYQKHLDYKGFSILSSAKVSDEGLYEARYLIHNLLWEREDILKAMIKSGCRFMVMAPTEMTTDVPEQRHLKNDPKTNWDQRARGLGGKLSSCGEENLLNLKGDRYRQENILIHEFNHAIHQQGLRIVDPTFNGRLNEAFDSAKEKGRWKGTYVATNPAEYWAEGAQAYFDCMRPQFGANTRKKLEKYDPGLFALLDEVYKQSQYRYVRYDQRNKKETEPQEGRCPGEASLLQQVFLGPNAGFGALPRILANAATAQSRKVI
jgi:predicted metalloprotease with PDZ domain